MLSPLCLALCTLLPALCTTHSKVISAGTLDEVRASLQGLERDVAGVLGGLPLYEPLFQLMCHGVPPRVKAATHRCGQGRARGC